MLLKVRQQFVIQYVIQYVSCGNRRFGVVELSKGHFTVSINEGLLIDTPNTFEVTDVERVLRA